MSKLVGYLGKCVLNGALPVDCEQQLPLVHAYSAVVSLPGQLGVFVDHPSLSQYICCSNFYLEETIVSSSNTQFSMDASQMALYSLRSVLL